MRLSLFYLVFFVCWISYGKSLLDLRAEEEKWTFKYDETQLGKFQTGFKKSKKKAFSYDNLRNLTEDVPSKFDWRERGVHPIRDQGNCGSCWAFSIISSTQDALNLLGKGVGGLLSEQYLVDCATDMYGCGGGMPSAFKWVTIPKGAPLLSDYPYRASDGRCQSKKIEGSVLEWHYIGESNRNPDIEEMKKAIYLYGPISVTVAADNAFVAYKSGIFNACSSGQTNHMTNIVGWDDSGEYWIMRNSWGSSWGEQGFMRIKWKGRNGALCNNLGEDSVYVKVDEKPIPPTPKEFDMESNTLELVVTLKSNAKYKVEDAKRILKPFLEALDE